MKYMGNEKSETHFSLTEVYPMERMPPTRLSGKHAKGTYQKT